MAKRKSSPKALSKAQTDQLKASVVPLKRMANPLAKSDRVTVRLDVFHEQLGENPVPFSAAFSRMLDFKSEAYIRKITAEPEEAVLGLGWIKPEKVGYIVIENRAGIGLQENPTAEEMEKLKQSFVRIAYKGDKHGWLIHPFGGLFFAIPENGSDLVIQSLTDESIRVNLYATVR